MSLAVSLTLTNFARGLSQDLTRGSLAEFLSPTVLVAAGTGQYKLFADASAFEIEDTSRPLGGDPNIINLEASDATYNCKPQALEARIDQKEREDYGDGDPLGIERIKTNVLVTRAALAYESRVITGAKTLAAVGGGTGVWISAQTTDPVDEIDTQIADIATKTGQMPNRLAISIGVWKVLRNHPKVLARFPGSSLVGVTTAQFAALLINPNIEIRVGTLGRNTAKQGAAKNIANMLGNELFVFTSSPGATQFDPSFMKTFRTRTGAIDSVSTYTAPNGLYDGLITKWSEDIQVTGAACARRISVT